MRKITQEAVNALRWEYEYTNSNTKVYYQSGHYIMSLHNNDIASINLFGTLRITNAWWFSTTTKERLNGLPWVSICQKKGTWYLNGKEWNGEWIVV